MQQIRPLIHIGYPKAASTWLQEAFFLPAHGFILQWMKNSEAKEAILLCDPFTFCAKHWKEVLGEGLQQAEKENLVPVISHEELTGEPWLGGRYVGTDVAERIVALFPDALILIIIREQCSAWFSAYQQHIKLGGTEPIDKYLRALAPGWRSIGRLEFLQYHAQIQHYRRLFGPDSVLVLPFEELRLSPQSFCDEITKFVGTPKCTPQHQKKANISVRGATIPTWRILNHFLDIKPNSETPYHFSMRLAFNLRKLIEVLVPEQLHLRVETSIKRHIEETVGDYYCSSNKITSQLIGRDLSALGYKQDCE